MSTVRRGLILMISLGLGGGCGDSTEGRLAPGAMARVRGTDGKSAPIFFNATTESLPEGTVVKVISDGEGDPSQARRKMVVGIEVGPSKGLAGLMYRLDLWPGG